MKKGSSSLLSAIAGVTILDVTSHEWVLSTPRRLWAARLHLMNTAKVASTHVRFNMSDATGRGTNPRTDHAPRLPSTTRHDRHDKDRYWESLVAEETRDSRC